MVVPLALGACGRASQPAGPVTSGKGVIHGAVANEKTGEGVANILVAVLQGRTVLQATATAADGQFNVTDLPPGAYTIRLTGFDVAGIDTRFVAFTPEAATVTVGAAPVSLAFAAVGLIPPRIAGYVTCGGQPVSGVGVRVIGGATDTTVVTNEVGKYGATNLWAGHYAVIVVSPPCPIAPPYQAADVKPGQEVTVDFGG
jgi:Carboxypeptidase regulatory-like domain